MGSMILHSGDPEIVDPPTLSKSYLSCFEREIGMLDVENRNLDEKYRLVVGDVSRYRLVVHDRFEDHR